jgi:hypothetical protein
LRKPGAGRKRATEADPELAAALERLVDPVTRGDPRSPLRWTCKSTTQLAGELTKQGHAVSPRTVGRLLKAAGYSGSDSSLVEEDGIHVCHFPPGTSKWNKIEHRMFCHIAQNWRGRPLVSHDVIINLIANTVTAEGLKIKAELDSGTYPLGIKIADEELANVNLKPAPFHGDWNYRILPKRRKKQST